MRLFDTAVDGALTALRGQQRLTDDPRWVWRTPCGADDGNEAMYVQVCGHALYLSVAEARWLADQIGLVIANI